MPRAERIVFAHVSVEVLPQISRMVSSHLSDSVLELADRLCAEMGGKRSPIQQQSSQPAFRDALLERVAAIKAAVPRRRATGLDLRLGWLGRTVDLTPLDVEILSHLVRAQLFEHYGQLLSYLADRPGTTGEVHIESLSFLIGRAPRAIQKRLEPGAPLVDAGLVRDCRGGDWAATQLSTRVAQMRTVRPDRLAEGLLGQAPRSTLGWQNFAHLGELRDLARGLVVQATRRKTGVNILLYGYPGTGKSEFARALAESCGLNAVMIGETDEYGREPERGERLGHLAVCRSLVRRSSQHLLIVDEAEDIMIQPMFGSSKHSKLYLNSLVERSTAPTLWIINEPSLMGSPVIRRMGLAIEFRLPDRAVRKELVGRIAQTEKVVFSPTEVDDLAGLEVAPAVMRNAVKAAAWTDRRCETAVLAATSIQRALGVARPVEQSNNIQFDPSLSHASSCLEELVAKLVAAPTREWSLLASGPPGTGKSALARHIAKLVGVEVIEKRASDLLDMYVGNTEKAIAAAFRQAADAKAMLIIDEADSLLRDRSLSTKSWEVSMTNEMLSWMERTPVPFVATTNLKDTLDPATARRFLFKIEFLALDAVRVAKLFTHYFRQPAPAALGQIDGLTPGDFSLVARKARLLGETRTDTLLAMLAIEADAKPHRRSAPIGFGGGPAHQLESCQ